MGTRDVAASELPRVVVVTGAMAAGKSTVAQLLAERLDRAVHLRGDAFRRMIVSGRVDPSPGTIDAWRGQLDLRYDLAAAAADRYAEAGFHVIYQDILTNALTRVVEQLGRWRPGVVVLCPSPAVLAAREAGRAKTGYKGWSPEAFDAMVRAETPKIGLWLDTSEMSAGEAADYILAHSDELRAGRAD
jgi:chloramphenicol 3-O-phosphotransferase